MARVCIRHPFILSENLCGRCGSEFCRECLVFPRGRKLPLCVSCAVGASGVRAKPAPTISKRKVKAKAKARKQEQVADTPKPLPDIANPVPAGWALGDAEELPAERAQRTVRESRERSRGRDADGDDAPNEMLTWLDSVYQSD